MLKKHKKNSLDIVPKLKFRMCLCNYFNTNDITVLKNDAVKS